VMSAIGARAQRDAPDMLFPEFVDA
jgi:hypothetical protein